MLRTRDAHFLDIEPRPELSGLRLAACALGLYARTTVVLRPYDRGRTMPLLLAFVSS
jgi:uncharacterized membrane protein YoaT (DUF817 family)